MIEQISQNSGTSPAADLTQQSASAKTLCHTPFGDVMVDELSAPNLAATFSNGWSDAKSASAVAQPAVVAPVAQAAAAASTAQAAAAASTAQAAAAASTAQAAAAPAAEQAAVVTSMAQAAVAADALAQDSAPTAESVFGANPWITDPTGTAPDGSSYGYNPLYFATAATAAQVAEMMGGKVVASDQLANAGGFVQQQPNEMVQLANGGLVNAGLVASFYTHGYPQSYIDSLIQNEIEGA